MLPTAWGEAIKDGESIEGPRNGPQRPHSQGFILLSQFQKKRYVVYYFLDEKNSMKCVTKSDNSFIMPCTQ